MFQSTLEKKNAVSRNLNRALTAALKVQTLITVYKAYMVSLIYRAVVVLGAVYHLGEFK